MRETSQEMARPPLGQTAARPGAVQPTAARPGAIQPAPRQAARPSNGYDPFLDEGEPSDFDGQRSWLRWGMAIGAVVVIGIIVGVYFGVIKGGSEPTTTLAPSTTVLATTTTEPEVQAQAVWAKLAPTGDLPAARSDHAVAVDTSTGSLFLFGGWDQAGVAFNDTWVFDSTADAWTKATPTGKSPSARAQHQMVFDPVTGKVILFGGVAKKDGTHLKDLWSYDPATKTWTELKPTGTTPSARSSFGMVYDDTDQQIIIFGGSSGTANLNDTWAYDAASNTWANLAPTGDAPSIRSGCSLVYDPVQSKVVLFGGADADTYLNDTWVYDYTANTWTSVTPTGDTPPVRADHRMTYDPTSATVVLFGGWDGTAYYNDTWAFDVTSSTWTDLSPAGEVPEARVGHSIIYDTATSELVLFGGLVGGTNVAQDTWSFGLAEEIPTEDTVPLTDETDVISGTTTTLEP
jgi:N-acetylneuraminic acid mutarotase